MQDLQDTHTNKRGYTAPKGYDYADDAQVAKVWNIRPLSDPKSRDQSYEVLNMPTTNNPRHYFQHTCVLGIGTRQLMMRTLYVVSEWVLLRIELLSELKSILLVQSYILIWFPKRKLDEWSDEEGSDYEDDNEGEAAEDTSDEEEEVQDGNANEDEVKVGGGAMPEMPTKMPSPEKMNDQENRCGNFCIMCKK